MRQFTVYDSTTGQVIRSGACSGKFLGAQSSTHPILAGIAVKDGSEYVDVTAAGQLPEEPTEAELETCRLVRPAIPDLNTVPAGTDVFVDGVYRMTVNDGTLVLSGDVPGAYRIKLVPPFPHIQMEFDHVVA